MKPIKRVLRWLCVSIAVIAMVAPGVVLYHQQRTQVQVAVLACAGESRVDTEQRIIHVAAVPPGGHGDPNEIARITVCVDAYTGGRYAFTQLGGKTGQHGGVTQGLTATQSPNPVPFQFWEFKAVSPTALDELPPWSVREADQAHSAFSSRIAPVLATRDALYTAVLVSVAALMFVVFINVVLMSLLNMAGTAREEIRSAIPTLVHQLFVVALIVITTAIYTGIRADTKYRTHAAMIAADRAKALNQVANSTCLATGASGKPDLVIYEDHMTIHTPAQPVAFVTDRLERCSRKQAASREWFKIVDVVPDTHNSTPGLVDIDGWSWMITTSP